MNISELLLNIKSVDFDSLVSQTAIQSESDKEAYQEKGYNIPLTEDEFKIIFDVDPSCIWYTTSVSQSCIYFNKETLAANLFPMEFCRAGLITDLNHVYRVIQTREAEVAEDNHMGSILALPDTMQIEYFRLLVGRKLQLPGLYELFFDIYRNSDYGFGKIDPNTLSTILASKTEADRKRTEQELRDLPETFKIYRGGNTSASTPYEKAYSWTLDINVANFFACRLGYDDGYIVEAEVKKSDVIDAFLSNRGEAEVIVDPTHLKICNKTKIYGLDFIAPLLPELAPLYHEYLDKMNKLSFAQDSTVHGREHQARVLLLCLTLSHLLDLPMRDRRALATAAIYHDTKRTNDDVDPTHGKASREYYHSNTKNPDPMVEFLCEYHCLPDDVGYQEIRNNRQLSNNRTRAKLLLDIFKDSDGLERVRLGGIRSLELNQLRLSLSKELSLVARIFLEQIKLPSRAKQNAQNLSQRISSAESRATPTTTNIVRNKEYDTPSR